MQIKRMICALLMVVLLMGTATVSAYVSDGDDEFYAITGLLAEDVVFRMAAADAPALPLDARAVILIEKETGEVLYELNSTEQRPIASITKIMTMILTMEAIEAGKISLEDPVVCSEHAYSMGGSQIWMEPGEVFSVDELLRAVAIASANDAAVALGEHISGSEDSFVAEMNKRAAELGMHHTVFKNACGLDEPGHFSTAYDVALMSQEALRHDLVRNYVTVWMDSLRGGETELTNTNKMLKTFNGITGLKTGTTSGAGVCIAASAQRENMELIAVVLGSGNSEGRFRAARELLDYGFANYELAELQIDAANITPVKVKLGLSEYCAYHYEVPGSIVVDRGKKNSITYLVEMAETQTAPIDPDQQLGEITVYSEGIVIGVYPITAVEPVAKIEFGSAFRILWQSLLKL